VDEELAFHFATGVEELVARGFTLEEAHEEMKRRFGDVATVRSRLTTLDRERFAGERRRDWWSALGQDVRYAMRGLRRSPVFTIGVVVTLALGIGANAAVFTIIDRLLLRPPPYVTDAEHLRRVHVEMTLKDGRTQTRAPMSYPEFAAIRDGVKAFDHVMAFNYPWPVALGRGVDAPRVKLTGASGEYFTTLGVLPAAGRFFVPEDDDDAISRPAAVLGYGLWQSRFDGQPGVIGQEIILDGRAFVIVGVAPKGFSGADLDAPDVWVPLAPVMAGASGPDWRNHKTSFGLHLVGHLRPGSSAAQAAAQATAAIRPAYEGTFMAALPKSVRLGSVIPGRRLDITDSGLSVAIRLLGAAAMVLLIACANVANLLLTRALARRRELAVRLALGVGRARLVTQLLSESVLLAVLAGTGAFLVAVWGGSAFRALLMPQISWATSTVDLRVLAFTGLIALLTGFAAGLAPAVQMTSHDLTDSLKSGWRDPSRSRSIVRSGLLLVQAAFTVILLVGAGLFVRSMWNARAVDLGFTVDRTILAEIHFAKGAIGRADLDLVYDRLVERVRRVPLVSQASVTTTAPFWTFSFARIAIPGYDSLPAGLRSPLLNMVPPEFIPTMGIRLTAGRGITPDDRAGSELVTLVNAAFANAAWPGDSPLGRCIKIGADTAPCRAVVGVVADVGFQNLHDPAAPQYYVPLPQAKAFDSSNRYIVIRAADRADLREVAASVRAALKGAHGGMEGIDVRPFLDLVAPEIRPFRLGATMFGIFGALALLLAGVGLYAVISFGVARRTRELGIRAALGARAADVVGLVFGEGVRVTMIGIAIGIVLALALGRAVEALLFGTSPRDPIVMAVVAITLLVVAAVASAIPAWRAARVDPLVALRED
jgi:predicted permease